MGHRRYAASAPLAEFVESFWFYEGDGSIVGRERTLPTGEMGLIINLRDDVMRVYRSGDPDRHETTSGSIVVGAYARHSIIDRTAQARVVGVQFRPGGAYPFFGYPAGDFQDQTISLEDAWGAGARELRERLLTGTSDAERLDALSSELLAHARWPADRDPAVALALRELHVVPQRWTIAQMREEAGLSSKRFIERFREQVGLPPKLFGRVRRFQGAVSRVFGKPSVDWADVALSCGYFDQAHFAHDFRGFTGLTPGVYLANQGEHINHVPLAE